MVKGWNTTKLITAGSLGVLHLILNLPASSIAIITGVPLSSGVINIFVGGIIFSLTVFIIDEFGAATIMILIYSILALPLPLSGTPGFLPKVIFNPLLGLFIDFVYLLSKKNKRLAAILVGGFSQFFVPIIVVNTGKVFNIPGISTAEKMFTSPKILVSVFIAGAISGYLGYLIFQKIKITSILQRIQKS